jgi:diguanylate cyclase (GGDEF)-like protein/PAS domain S-box-containing protein
MGSAQAMRFQYTPYFGALMITAVISAVVAFIAWQRRATPGGAPLALLMLAVTEWALVSGLEAAAVGQAAKILWSKLEYVGNNSTAVFLLIFAMRHTGRDKWLTRHNVGLLWVIPILNMVAAATNEWHGLIWTGFTPGPNGTNLLIYHHGPWFWFVIASIYAYVSAATLLFVRSVLRPSILHRRQAILILIASAPPWIGSIVYLSDLSPIPGLNVIPMSFMITGLVLLGSIFRFHLFDLVPVARDTLVESMSDGLLVLDAQNRIVDVNPAAQQLLGANSSCIGKSAEQVLAKWPDLVNLSRASEDAQTEVLLDNGGPRYFDVRITSLQDRHGRFAGQFIDLRDITQRHLATTGLEQANARLVAQLEVIDLLRAQLQEQAIRDELTGLFNRRYLQETLPRELSRAARGAYPVAVVMMDIDRFKAINDRYGHKAGDLILQAVGELLHAQIRCEDIACRYGGEEFVLVFPALPLEHAYRRAEQLRLSFEALRVEYEGAELSTTISAGVAVFPNHGETDEDLLRAADQALYAAKAAGRNCVKIWQ